jgi:hypothetical protein
MRVHNEITIRLHSYFSFAVSGPKLRKVLVLYSVRDEFRIAKALRSVHKSFTVGVVQTLDFTLFHRAFPSIRSAISKRRDAAPAAMRTNIDFPASDSERIVVVRGIESQHRGGGGLAIILVVIKH